MALVDHEDLEAGLVAVEADQIVAEVGLVDQLLLVDRAQNLVPEVGQLCQNVADAGVRRVVHAAVVRQGSIDCAIIYFPALNFFCFSEADHVHVKDQKVAVAASQDRQFRKRSEQPFSVTLKTMTANQKARNPVQKLLTQITKEKKTSPKVM